MARRVCLLDLDDCLYRSDTIHTLVRAAIEFYLLEKLGVAANVVSDMTNSLYVEYGTTVAGLLAKGYKIDLDDWHSHVHDQAIDYDTLLKPDPELRAILLSIKEPKYIFTNANTMHAEKCLARLGISDCFEGVFDLETVMDLARAGGVLTKERPMVCKPMKLAYDVVLKALGVSADDVFFADDSGRNITAAHDMGICSIFVGKDALPEGVRAHFAMSTLHQLPKVLPQILAYDASHHSVSRATLSEEVPVERVESGVPITVTAS